LRLGEHFSQPVTLIESQQLIHQLQLRQIELELQNRMLFSARDDLEQRLERYTDLYNFAPMGYATLTSDGAIQDINLTGANLLGIPRNRLLKRRFGLFVSPETLPAFNALLDRMMNGASPQSCEIILNTEGASPRNIRLEGLHQGFKGGRLFHLAMFDVTDYKQSEELLKLSEARYQAIVESQNDLICRFLSDGALTFANNAYYHYFGHTYDDLLNMNTVAVVPEEVRADIISRVRTGHVEHPFNIHEQRVTRADGAVRWVRWVNQAILDHDQALIEIQSIGRDVTEQRHTEEALRNSEARYRRIVETAQEGIWLVDAEERTTFVNARLTEMLNYTAEEMQGRSWFDFMDEESRKMARRRMENQDYTHTEQYDVKFRCKDGRAIWMLASINSLLDRQGRYAGALGMMVDITDRKQMEEELRRLATLDPLTGLFNRRQFFTVAEKEFERCQRYNHTLAALMLDIDHFKRINDTFGHQTGDQVLQTVASIMRDRLRRVDVLGRYGGEEFVMLLPETSRTTAMATANRLCAALAATSMPIEGEDAVSVTVSIGVAALTDCMGVTLEQLLARADQALYEAKNAGRNQVRSWGGDDRIDG
jgi:diguanylate cyclase (GGDEF)-like protein/PAS domain S-box-containing protein